jgi:uracil-DNA glycosylase family 4
MTSSPSVLRAYLEFQAELGTDEVILPYPLERRQNPATETAPAALRPGNGASAPRAYSANRDQSPESRPGGPSAEDGTRAAGLEPHAPTESLIASLSQAISAASGQAVAPQPAVARPRAESASLPAFPDLAAYWEYLAAHTGAAAGDPEAQGVSLVKAQGNAGAPLAIIGLEPGEADAASGRAFQGEPGALLAKMLKAIRLDAEACYRTHLVKAARATRATRRDLGRLLPWLHAELALVQAPVALLLGEPCAQAVLKTGKPIEELRQEPFRVEGREFVVTYHPAELLVREELKRKAWEDLQWLQKRMAEGA